MSVLTDNTAKLRKILEKVENLPEMPPSVAQATPTISVSSSGLITATATQEAGAVAAGTKTATRQLTTKGGTTITPGDSEQTAVSAGTYVTGDIKVAAAAGGKQVATGSFTLRSPQTEVSIAPGFVPTNLIITAPPSANQGKQPPLIYYFDGSGKVYYFSLFSDGYDTVQTNARVYQMSGNTYVTTQSTVSGLFPAASYFWIATT